MNTKHRQQQDWCTNEKLWTIMGAPMFDKTRTEAAKTEVQQLISLLNIDQNNHLLDLCCGNGRHLLEFTRKGYHITGVDITASYLDDLKSKASQEDIKVNVIRQDARQYVSHNTFDVVYNLYASFGYFENETDNILLLKNMYDSLKPKGRLLVNIIEKEHTKRSLLPFISYETEGTLCAFKQSLSADERWLNFESTFTKQGGTETIRYKIRLYQVQDIHQLLEKTGFTNICCYENLLGHPHRNGSTDLFIGAQK